MRATFRFYGALNDFLPAARRQARFAHAVEGRASVKDVVESLGVPHPEVRMLLVNGEPAAFDRVLEDGDDVSAYPQFDLLDPGQGGAAPPPEPDVRFVLDGHLGRLAAYLRALGFDVWHRRDADDAELAQVSASQDRVLLSRDVGLLKRAIVRRGGFVRAERPPDQVAEVLRRFRCAGRARPFTRCLRCNEPLRAAAAGEVAAKVPPRARGRHDEFLACPACGRVFWRGTHHARLSGVLEAALRDASRR